MATPKKIETHERIVSTAARALRRAGYEGVSVAEIMKDAGLTHGGFYAHFASRDALVEEALERATSDSLGVLAQVTGDGGGIAALAEQYLSDAHLESPEHGCCMASLGTETRRQPDAVRAIAARGMKQFVALVERDLPAGLSESERRDEAMLIVSALVGAMVIARAVESPTLSRQFRAAAKRFVSRKAR